MQHLPRPNGRIQQRAARLDGRLWAALLSLGSGLATALLPAAADTVQDSSASKLLSIAELQSKLVARGRAIESFRIEGVVCAVVRGRNLLALQDGSAGVVLEVPALDQSIQAGQWVAVSGNHCALTRSRFGLQLGTAPVVNNDGHHRALVKSGSVFLEAGWQPIRLTWFNGYGASALQVEYEGPGIPREKIPAAALRRKPGEARTSNALETGLDFAAYTGDWRYTLPDFQKLRPVAQGVATNFDLHYSVRAEEAALAFSGYINIATAGIYTFFLESDDGGYLYAGEPGPSCHVTALRPEPVLVPKSLEEARAGPDDHRWIEVEGEVTFAGQNEQDLELELAAKGGERVQLAVAEASSLSGTNLLHRHVRAAGILEVLPDPEQRKRARVFVPCSEQLEIDESAKAARPPETPKETVLTTIEQVRHLTPAEAGLALPAKLKGVVTWSSHSDLVLQDATGGVYIQYIADGWAEQPGVGELWEIAGTTDPGDFSPVIRAQKETFVERTTLPEPIRPTWDQLLSGSLDAEYIELRGALTEVSPRELTLLTSEGKIKIEYQDDHPLPRLPPPPVGHASYVDSIVRIRGCVAVQWDGPTRQVRAGVIHIGSGTIEIEEWAPADPFALATRKTADLLRFDPGAGLLQRTKVKGQVVFRLAGEYCLQDGESGLRLRTKEPVDLRPGDLVEAVGFPQLGGPSPVLQEARVRTNGALSFPAPIPLSARQLQDRSHDSTLVQVEAMLVEDRANREERVLALQAGQSHFTAHLKSPPAGTRPLAAGSRLQVTGVYLSVGSEAAGGNLDDFQLWLSSPADLRVLQQPSWWTLRRASTIMALLSGVLGMALVWITLLHRQVAERTAQLQKQIEERQVVEQRRLMEQERTRVAQDLHDELGAGLTEVSILGSLAKTAAIPLATKERYVDQLTEVARSLVATLDEIVWAVNPHYDTVGSLVTYYSLFAQRFLNLAGIACRLEVSEAVSEHALDSKLRHGIFRAFKEALNNVVRHSGATEVRLAIEVSAQQLMLCVTDNGCGFDLSRTEPGADGLRGMRQRMQDLGGSCQITSQPGQATTVEFRLALNGTHHDQSRHSRGQQNHP